MLPRSLVIIGLLVMLLRLNPWLNSSTLMVTYLLLILIFAFLLWLGVFVVRALLRFSLHAHLFVVIIAFSTFVSGPLVGRRRTLKTYFCALLLLVRLAYRIRRIV